MSTPFIGEIRLFGFGFPPRGWALCEGQLLPISQNQALFSLLGTTYGGNGTTDFALPDLRGRVPLHHGQGPGFPSYVLGQQGGVEEVTLTIDQLGPHSHLSAAQSGAGTSASPFGDVWARSEVAQYGTPAAASMDPAAVSPVGASQPHDNLAPYLTLNYCIALQGIFPSRS